MDSRSKLERYVKAIEAKGYHGFCHSELQSEGFNVLGSGCYGVVLQGDNNRVLKLCKKSDLGYKTFLDIMMNVRSPYLPIVYQVIETSRFFVIEMEKLEKVWDAEYNTPRHVEDLHNLIARYCRSFKRTYYNPGPPPVIADEDLKALLDLMVEAWEPLQRDLCWDLHNGNFMMRGNQLVITDPWA